MDRLLVAYPYYASAGGSAPAIPVKKPVDEGYALFLTDPYIAAASEGHTPADAAQAILPRARRYFNQGVRTVPRRLFEAVGLAKLGRTDAITYSSCLDDPAERAKVLRGATVDATGGQRPSLMLVGSLAAAGDYDGADAVLEKLLADPATHDSTKANAAYNLANRLNFAGRKERAKALFELVVERFPNTPCARLSKIVLVRGLKLPWEGRTQ